MTSGIYAYWDNANSYYVYVGKDTQIDAKYNRNYQHLLPSGYDGQQINKVLQNNPERYEYRVIMEGDYNDWQLNQMEKLCIKSFRTYKYDYPNRSVFNFTPGGDGGGLPGVHNYNYRVDINDDEVKRLYCEEGLSVRKISEIFDTTHKTISERLKKQGIEVNDGVSGENNILYRHDLNNDKIVNMYIDEGLSITEIAEILNAYESLIFKRLKEKGIFFRGNTGIDLEEDEIIRLYCEENLSVREIAKIFNVTHATISRRLKNNGIKIRGVSEQNLGKNNPAYRDDIPSPSMLLEEYLSSNITQKELAKKYNCSKETIRRRLKKARGEN